MYKSLRIYSKSFSTTYLNFFIFLKINLILNKIISIKAIEVFSIFIKLKNDSLN